MRLCGVSGIPFLRRGEQIILLFFIGEGLLLPADDGAEGQQRELRLLEALEAEGDADDGDAQQYAVEQGLEGKEDAAEYEPEHVEDGGAGSAAVLDLLAEREEREAGHLEALRAHRDAHDGDAPQRADENPAHALPKPREDEPQYVADNAHVSSFPPVAQRVWHTKAPEGETVTAS